MLSVLMALALTGLDGVAARSTAELYASRPDAARAIVNEALGKSRTRRRRSTEASDPVVGASSAAAVRERLAPVHELAHVTIEVR